VGTDGFIELPPAPVQAVPIQAVPNTYPKGFVADFYRW
jgi:hypothetical protein